MAAKSKLTPAQQNKVATVLHEFKAGRLHSGSKKGPKVSSRRQAIAIAMNQAGAKMRRRN